MKALLWLLLLSSEIVSTPIAPRNNLLPLGAPAIALARDSEGVVIAWPARDERGVNRINVARLDASAHLAGSVHVLPASDASDASNPSIAVLPSGSGFTIAWMEYESDSEVRTMFTRLDAGLNPDVPVLLTTSTDAATMSPVVVRSGSSTWITAASRVWQILPDGKPDTPLEAGVPASDMIANAPVPRLVGATKPFAVDQCMQAPGCRAVGGPFNGLCYASCVIHVQRGYGLRLIAPFTAFAGPSFNYESDAQPAIQSDGRDVLVAWYSGAEASGGSVVVNKLTDQSLSDFEQLAMRPREIGSFAPESGRVRADIATDGERYLVVWQTKHGLAGHDIEAASIDRDGTITPITIANSADDEREPSVISTRPGTFLVAYEKISQTDRRIAGRLVTFDGRGRAVR